MKSAILIWSFWLASGWTLGYVVNTMSAPKPLSEQIDLKAGKSNVEWTYKKWNVCEGICRNYSSSTSSWWGGWGGSYWGGK